MKGVRLEKVSDTVVRVIVEKPSDVPIEQLINNRDKILKNIEDEQRRLDTHEDEKKIAENIENEKRIVANIDEMLEECKTLGIRPKAPEAPTVELRPTVDNPDDGD